MAETKKEHVNDVNAQGLNRSFAVSNKWIGYFPIENVVRKAKGVELNLTAFTVPQVTLGSTSVPYKGYNVEMPTKLINAETKRLNVNYIIKSDWSDYMSLYAWAADIGIFVPTTPEAVNESVETGVGENTGGMLKEQCINSRIWLIGPYKNHIVDFVFYDSWIVSFGDLQMDVKSAEQVHHSFTIAYSRFTVEAPRT